MQNIVLEKSNVEELRAERVWRLMRVSALTWVFFACFLGWRGFGLGSTICAIEVVAFASTFALYRNHKSYRRVMNLNLGFTGIGLVCLSLSDPSLRCTMLFFPISILVASQLLGIRAAFQWLIVNIAATTIFYCTAFGLAAVWNLMLDELILVYGVAICVFFCCEQGEAFYLERTRDLTDLSDRLRIKGKRLKKLATTDSLTGLVNRHQFREELNRCLAESVESNRKMALLVIDMDGFKEINDTLGHPVGDQALIEVANRLRRDFGERAVVSRLGGDEFCVIFPEVESCDEVHDLARFAWDSLTERYLFGEYDFPLGTSVGTAICPDDTVVADDLLAFADTAMFVAKENQIGFSAYAPNMTERLVEYRTMQEKLSTALERDEFFLVYQPQVCLASGSIMGVEALLRWRSDGEVISPLKFIPFLEKSREIVPVGRWIIRESCRQLREWQDEGFDIEVSINVSSVQFNDEDFNESIEQSVKEFGIDASKLDFELTESLLIEDVDQAVERLSEIKALGASISIDDFGTGYSSLAYLRQFPLDRLKIDRAFVKDIPDGDDGVIAKSIIALSKAIGLKVLAEGVETEEQLKFLKSFDCDEYQGYLFSRPVTPDEITARLQSSKNFSKSLSTVV